MEEQEVKGRKVAIDIVKANIFAVMIMVVAAIVFHITLLLFNGLEWYQKLTYNNNWQSCDCQLLTFGCLDGFEPSL